MQLISFIPNRNWLFQYGRLGLGLVATSELGEVSTMAHYTGFRQRKNVAMTCAQYFLIANAIEIDQNAIRKEIYPHDCHCQLPHQHHLFDQTLAHWVTSVA